MFNTKPKQITNYLQGLSFDLKEVLKYTNFEESDIRPVEIKQDAVKVGIDSISFKNISPQRVPYIAPTISPGLVSLRADYLEHPQEIFDEYIEKGQVRLIGEKKHMGSNATIYVFASEDIAEEYTGERKRVYTISRAGFNFFVDPKVDEEFHNKLIKTLDDIDYFNTFGFKFAIWNAEILPWNLKAGKLLSKEYLPALDLSHALYSTLQDTFKANPDNPARSEFKKYTEITLEHIEEYHKQLQHYCSTVSSVSDIKVAPFHLLATNKGTYFKETHKSFLEHFNHIAKLTNSELIVPTEYVEVDLTSQESMDAAIEWWEGLTKDGYEGAIFKTWRFTEPGTIPMLKCRGKEYLRIVYGINYDMPDQIVKHKSRRTSKKRRLHKAETLLGILSLEAFVNKKDNHDYMLALLALADNDGVDIRL